MAAIATSFAGEHGINKGLIVFEVDVEEAGATPEQLLTWMSARRPGTPTWEPPRTFAHEDHRKLQRLRLVASPCRLDGTTLVRDLGAFLAPVLHLLDPRHRSWVREELDVKIPRALADAALFAVHGSRGLTCCGSREVVARAEHAWIVIQDYAYC